LPNKHGWIYATVGIHPHEAKEVTQQHLDDLARLSKRPKVIAWGEIGLDYYYDHSPRDVQHRVFRDQMALAEGAKLPIIIHCRDAWSDCLSMIEERWRPTGLGGILHCFTSTLEDARRGIEMGFLISFAGNSTYPKTQNLRDVAKELPLENILIETDSPYLAAAALARQAQRACLRCRSSRAPLANVRNLSPDEVAAATSENFGASSVCSAGNSRAPGLKDKVRSGDLLSRCSRLKRFFDLVRDDLVLVEEELGGKVMPPFRPSLKSPRICWAGREAHASRAPASSASYAGRKDAAPSPRRVVELLHSATLIHAAMSLTARTWSDAGQSATKWRCQSSSCDQRCAVQKLDDRRGGWRCDLAARVARRKEAGARDACAFPPPPSKYAVISETAKGGITFAARALPQPKRVVADEIKNLFSREQRR